MHRLLMIAPAPVIEKPGGVLRLDVKFLEGMRLQSSLWRGRTDCALRRGAESIPFGLDTNATDLGYGLRALAPAERLSAADITPYDIVICSGDMPSELHLAQIRSPRPKIIYVVEYTFGTSLRIVLLDRDLGLPRKLWSLAWNLRQELRRRRAFRRADGLQINGYPAHAVYQKLNPNTLLYLDSRMTPDLLATDAEMASRADRLLSGAPLRLFYSGRLEPMKGAQDLIPVARALTKQGLAFTLDIYGSGSLRAEIAAGISDGLSTHVTLHDPVDFETALVPRARGHADLFLACHRQADPSCTYLESMGCGLAVVGYDNAMWAALAKASHAGWTTPLGNPAALALEITRIAADRPALVKTCANARSFAAAHDHLTESNHRTDHLRATLTGQIP